MSEIKLKCTLTDNELVDKSKELVSKLCETGGHSWCLRVPVDLNNDPDIIFTELGNRVLSLRAQLSEAQEEIGRMNISLELQADRVDKLIDENVKAESELAKEQHENEQLIILRDEYEELVGNVALILGCTDEWSNCHDHRCCIAENATRIVRENAALRERLKKVEEVYNENKNEENEGFNEEMKNVFWQAIKAACEA